MKFGSITSRRCRRCLAVSVAQLPNTPKHKATNTHLLCDKCLTWQANNPGKPIR